MPGLQIPAGTASLRLQLISLTTERPALHLTLREGASTLASVLGPTAVASNRISTVIFLVPRARRVPARVRGRLGVPHRRRSGEDWGGIAAAGAPAARRPRLQGRSAVGPDRAVVPAARDGARSSYLARAGAILRRASLFRAGVVGPWLYVLLLLVVLPALALASIRRLAVAQRGGHPAARGCAVRDRRASTLPAGR